MLYTILMNTTTKTVYPRTVIVEASSFDQGDLSWLKLEEGEMIVSGKRRPDLDDEYMKWHEFTEEITIDLKTNVFAPELPKATLADVMPPSLLALLTPLF